MCKAGEAVQNTVQTVKNQQGKVQPVEKKDKCIVCRLIRPIDNPALLIILTTNLSPNCQSRIRLVLYRVFSKESVEQC